MRKKILAAALVAAAVYYAVSVSEGRECRTEYKDVYEQMRMEQLITYHTK